MIPFNKWNGDSDIIIQKTNQNQAKWKEPKSKTKKEIKNIYKRVDMKSSNEIISWERLKEKEKNPY